MMINKITKLAVLFTLTYSQILNANDIFVNPFTEQNPYSKEKMQSTFKKEKIERYKQRYGKAASYDSAVGTMEKIINRGKLRETEIEQLLYKAKQYQNEYSQYLLAELLLRGIGLEKNRLGAISLLKLSALTYGYTPAYSLLGETLMEDAKNTEEEKIAFNYLKKAYNKGNSNAIVPLSKAYFNGKGTQIDKKRAYELLRMPSLLKFPSAKLFIKENNINESEFNKSVQSATKTEFESYQKLENEIFKDGGPTKEKFGQIVKKAQEGDKKYQLIYFTMLHDGILLKKQPKKARKHTMNLVKQSYIPGIIKMVNMQYNLRHGKALHYAKELIRLKNKEGYYIAGQLYYSGSSGAQENKIIAESYIRKASFMNHERAIEFYNDKNLIKYKFDY